MTEKFVKWEQTAQSLPTFQPVRSDPAKDPPPKLEPEEPVQPAPQPNPGEKFPFRGDE